MIRVYDNQTPPIKWCLQRIFKEIELTFINSRYSETVFYHEPALYYGFGKEFSTDTFEECTPIPLNFIKILTFATRERKKKDIQNYLLKPLSKELYERLRKSYPHRHKDNREQDVNYEEILCEPQNSLFHEKELEGYPFPPDYEKWKEKIIRYTKAKRYEEAIFLLNHLFMGDADDSEAEMREELEARYCSEFNLDPGSAIYNILVVDDFFFLHIYQFSLVERHKARYDEEQGVILPKIHFHFECLAESAINKLDDNEYEMILLDIDFGQQCKGADEVAKKTRDKGIPIVMFSKFELADKYDKFQVNWGSLPRIKKDLNFKELYASLMARLEDVRRIKTNERIHHELENVRMIQQGFLPKETPNIDGLEIWGKNQSFYEVSGDYFDFIYLKKAGLFIFVIADVSGKGLPASLIMSGAYTALHAILQEKLHPERVIRRLNQIVHKITPIERFITFFYGEINLETLELHYVNAGHNAPFIVSPSGDIRELEKGGFMLGFFPEHIYESEVIELQKGDIICLYTDGVPEGLNLNSEEPDPDPTSLKDFFKIKKAWSATEIGNEIFEKLKKSSDPTKSGDDQTMVIIRVKPD
jgi:serine phosphatase RsbU (regulator of sigma subunit)